MTPLDSVGSLFNLSSSCLFFCKSINWEVISADVLNIPANTSKALGCSASIITSNNSRLTVNNLEQAYVEDELITGDSGKIRTVYKTTLAT